MVARQPKPAIQLEPSGVFNWCGHSLIAGLVKGTGALWDTIHLRLNLSSGFCREAINQSQRLCPLPVQMQYSGVGVVQTDGQSRMHGVIYGCMLLLSRLEV